MAQVLEKLISKAKALGRSVLTADGSEVPDPTPVEMPVGFERPQSIQEMIRTLVTDPAMRAELEGRGMESFDEADDFEIEDDFPQSPHEDQFDPEHLLSREQEIMSGTVAPRTPQEIQAALAEIAKYRKSTPKAAAGEEPKGPAAKEL